MGCNGNGRFRHVVTLRVLLVAESYTHIRGHDEQKGGAHYGHHRNEQHAAQESQSILPFYSVPSAHRSGDPYGVAEGDQISEWDDVILLLQAHLDLYESYLFVCCRYSEGGVTIGKGE